MRTLAQEWAERLTELRAICRENGERLDVELRRGFRRDTANGWWSRFCDAAEAGADLSPAVWRSARAEGRSRKMEGWVTRLAVRNQAKRSSSFV